MLLLLLLLLLHWLPLLRSGFTHRNGDRNGHSCGANRGLVEFHGMADRLEHAPTGRLRQAVATATAGNPSACRETDGFLYLRSREWECTIPFLIAGWTHRYALQPLQNMNTT